MVYGIQQVTLLTYMHLQMLTGPDVLMIGKLPVVLPSLSTAESEYIATAGCCTQILWMKQMLKDIHQSGDIDVFPKLSMVREPTTDDCKYQGTQMESMILFQNK